MKSVNDNSDNGIARVHSENSEDNANHQNNNFNENKKLLLLMMN